MTARIKRLIADWTIWIATLISLQLISGHGWIVFIAVPFGLWNYYDGLTRSNL